MTAALKLEAAVKLAEMVVGIEALTAARALDLRGVRSTAVLERARERFRRAVPGWTEDCVLSGPMEAAGAFVRADGFGEVNRG